MVAFADIELFALGAALVIDTALLLMLTDANNRRRLVVPLVIVIAGAWLYHAGALGQALLRDGAAPLTATLQRLAALVAALGALLMPSAVLHGLLRASLTGVGYQVPRDARYALLYLPLLALLPFAAGLFGNQAGSAGGLSRARWETIYLGWLLLANAVAGCGFLRLYRAPTVSLNWARQFVRAAGWGLLALVLVQGGLALRLLAAGADEPWRLLLSLSPLPLLLLVGYFIVRFNFLQLVLERVLIYGALATAAILFHQVFLQDLWRSLSDRYRINFALVEGIALVALVLLVRPLRRRSAEALHYLLGHRVVETRRRTRELALAMAAQAGRSQDDVLNWFVVEARRALAVDGLAVWLFDETPSAVATTGRLQRHGALALADGDALALHAALRDAGMTACRPGSAPQTALGDAMIEAGVAAAVAIEHPRLDGLVAVGRGGGDMVRERLNALVMVVEQLAFTLDGSRLQAERRRAERRALQNDKLSALGLVAGSIAHEVKNPLSSIRTVATVMAEDLPPDSPLREDVQLIVDEVGRLATTVDRLLQFARPGRPDDRPTRLQRSADTVLQVMRHLARQRGVTLLADLDPALPPLDADAASLNEILFNLIGNAIDAAGTGGRVELAARRLPAGGDDGHDRSRNNDTDDGGAGFVALTVSDDGPGVPAELLPRLFEPFISGKPDGTGLGLYLVALRSGELGGAVDCASGADGTTFTVRLPISDDAR